MLANFGGHLLVRLLCTVVSARSFVRFCPIVVALYGSSVLLWLGGGGILDHILWSSIHSNSTASFTVRSKNLLSDMVLVILHSNKCDPFCLLPPSFPRSSFPFSFLPLPPPFFPSPSLSPYLFSHLFPTRPRLGDSLGKVVAVGVIYFVFALIEGIVRTRSVSLQH